MSLKNRVTSNACKTLGVDTEKSEIETHRFGEAYDQAKANVVKQHGSEIVNAPERLYLY